ncbi:MAG: hypothetical protein U0792_12560, partial [Gemmataceae bacterium]
MSNLTQPLGSSPCSSSRLGRQPHARVGIGHSLGLALLLAFSWPTPTLAQQPKDDPRLRADSKAGKASAKFFDEGLIPEMRIEINAEQLKKLKENNRAYVLCTVTETLMVAGKKTETTYTDVGIKMKGAAG